MSEEERAPHGSGLYLSSLMLAHLRFWRDGRKWRQSNPEAPTRENYSTTYPSARALSMTRESLVRIVTSCGGSPNNSAVARWRASSVRSGSTGKGRPARASTASVIATTSQRRLNACNQRSAARSSAGVKRCATRARTRAREASANVSAEVIRRRFPRRELRAVASRSSRAASKALVSTYLNVVAAPLAAAERRPERRVA
jgi:hypothetical protein